MANGEAVDESRFLFRQTDTIGAADAADDDFLVDAFVDAGFLEVLRDCDDSRQVLVGRTGAGKTALLRILSQYETRVIQIAPESLALSYISNSTILKLVSGLGVNLEPFFKLLWRHVLVVELLRRRFPVGSASETPGWLERLFNRGDKRTKKALDYLRKWGESFWEDTDYRILEVTRNLEKKIEGSCSLGGASLGSSFDGARTLNHGEKAEVVRRAQTIVNEVQVRELATVLDVVNDALCDGQKRYYITIDRLDEEWVHEGIRLKLIRALIEAVTAFKRVQNAKVIIALREDLLERVFQETRDAGFQREKYESRTLRLSWDATKLEEVLDLRVQALVRRRYTKAPVALRDILPQRMGRKSQAIDSVQYILDRTLMRPRDAIAFLNCAIRSSAGKPKLSQHAIRDAEVEHSNSRTRAVIDEWVGLIPGLRVAIDCLAHLPANLCVRDLDEDVTLSCVIALEAEPNQGPCVLHDDARRVMASEIQWQRFRVRMVLVLYQVGIVGLKVDGQRLIYSSSSPWEPSESDVYERLKLVIHPMFRRALRTKTDRPGT